MKHPVFAATLIPIIVLISSSALDSGPLCTVTKISDSDTIQALTSKETKLKLPLCRVKLISSLPDRQVPE